MLISHHAHAAHGDCEPQIAARKVWLPPAVAGGRPGTRRVGDVHGLACLLVVLITAAGTDAQVDVSQRAAHRLTLVRLVRCRAKGCVESRVVGRGPKLPRYRRPCRRALAAAPHEPVRPLRPARQLASAGRSFALLGAGHRAGALSPSSRKWTLLGMPMVKFPRLLLESRSGILKQVLAL